MPSGWQTVKALLSSCEHRFYAQNQCSECWGVRKVHNTLPDLNIVASYVLDWFKQAWKMLVLRRFRCATSLTYWKVSQTFLTNRPVKGKPTNHFSKTGKIILIYVMFIIRCVAREELHLILIRERLHNNAIFFFFFKKNTQSASRSWIRRVYTCHGNKPNAICPPAAKPACAAAFLCHRCHSHTSTCNHLPKPWMKYLILFWHVGWKR